MQEIDGKGFERALARLCAAFDVPMTDPRREAYWRSFRKTTLLEFTGLIDMALVESTFASMPTVGALWELHRKLQPAKIDHGTRGPSVQERLFAYVSKRLSDRPCGKFQYTTFVYRGDQCIGWLGECIDGSRIAISVDEMESSQMEFA